MRVINLCSGPGDGVTTACLRTATNMLVGRPDLGDSANEHNCLCPVIAEFILPTNDEMPDSLRAELYTPLIWEIIGTRSDDCDVIVARAECAAKWADTFAARAADAARAATAARAAYAATAARAARDAAYAARAADAATAAYAARAAAADAARDAAYAAYAARAADAAEIWRLCPAVIREMAAIGDTRPVETVMTHDQLADALNSDQL